MFCFAVEVTLYQLICVSLSVCVCVCVCVRVRVCVCACIYVLLLQTSVPGSALGSFGVASCICG